jgi:hypothetical protein
MTLDVYAGLFADDLDGGADRLNALEPSMCPESWGDPAVLRCCTDSRRGSSREGEKPLTCPSVGRGDRI